MLTADERWTIKMNPSGPLVKLSENISLLPIVEGSATSCEAVRQVFVEAHPALVAVELPALLRPQILDSLEKLPVMSMIVYEPDDFSPLLFAVEPCDPRIEAIRQAMNKGITVELIDSAQAAHHEDHFQLPDPVAALRTGDRFYSKKILDSLQGFTPTARHRFLYCSLSRLSEDYAGMPIIAVVRMTTAAGLMKYAGQELEDSHDWEVSAARVHHIGPVPHTLVSHFVRELPYIVYTWENERTADRPFSLPTALKSLLRKSAAEYQKQYDEEVDLTRWRTIFQYARNLAALRRQLVPGVRELVTAAAGVVNDDFAAILLEIASVYPPNLTEEDEPSGTRRSLNIYIDRDGEKVRVMPAYPGPELTELQFKFKRRPIPSKMAKEAWRENFHQAIFFGSGICSWPPEDHFIEKFFRQIRERANQRLSDDHTSVEEFSSSILDGLDVRESIRNWHRKKIYVRRDRKPPGKVGPVVLIWRDLPVDYHSIWQECLYAENQNESDIAIYADEPGREMVGPGITRIEYHGILSVYPAIGIPDVWSMLALQRWDTCARLLIAAAIMMSEEKYIAVVAKQPPDKELQEYARENGRALIYLPLETFSNAQLHRARRCHILAGHNVRQWAADFIPER